MTNPLLSLIRVGTLLVVLGGCSDHTSLSGMYLGDDAKSRLTFNGDIIEFTVAGHEIHRPFVLVDDHLHIDLRKKSSEQRDELVMYIQEHGQVLTCNSCGKYRLANVWYKAGSGHHANDGHDHSAAVDKNLVEHHDH